MLSEHTQLPAWRDKALNKTTEFHYIFFFVEKEGSTDIQNSKKISFYNLKDFLQLNWYYDIVKCVFIEG
jgi:hypothetical protein